MRVGRVDGGAVFVRTGPSEQRGASTPSSNLQHDHRWPDPMAGVGGRVEVREARCSLFAQVPKVSRWTLWSVFKTESLVNRTLICT